MKILFHSNLFPDRKEDYRGQDNANLLHRLADFAQVRVIAPRPVLPFFPRRPVRPREVDALFQPMFPHYRYIPKVGSAFNHHLLRAAVRRGFLQITGEFQPDLLLASWAYPDTCGVVPLALECGLPVVAVTQGSDVHIHLRMPLRRKLISRVLSNCQTVITRSGQLGQLLADAGVPAQKLRTVYNGVAPEVFHPGCQKNARQSLNLLESASYLLYVGNFYPVKNPFLLLEALAATQQEVPERDIRLLMIGEGPLQGRVEGTIRNLGLSSSAQLLGRKTPEEVAAFMRAANLLCIPSDNEGLPNVLLEALSCGLPVVSTDVGGIHEVLREKHLGSLVPAGNETAMASAIAQRLGTLAERDRIASFSEQFSWDRTVQTYREILEAAISRNPPLGA